MYINVSLWKIVLSWGEQSLGQSQKWLTFSNFSLISTKHIQYCTSLRHSLKEECVSGFFSGYNCIGGTAMERNTVPKENIAQVKPCKWKNVGISQPSLCKWETCGLDQDTHYFRRSIEGRVVFVNPFSFPGRQITLPLLYLFRSKHQ